MLRDKKTTIDDIIVILETEIFERRFPLKLKQYIIDEHESKWPHVTLLDTMYSDAFQSVEAFYSGKLKLKARTTKERLTAQLNSVIQAYGDAQREIMDLNEYIDELHGLLSENGIGSSRRPIIPVDDEFLAFIQSLPTDYELPFM